MKLHDSDKTKAKKVDVILWGVETIGSAERSTDTSEMRNQFYSIKQTIQTNHPNKPSVCRKLCFAGRLFL